MGSSDLLEALFELRAKNLPPIAFAEVLDRLVWCLDDNGHDIVGMQRRWLAGDDPERLRVALKMAEVFPFASQEDMDGELDRISVAHPGLAVDCREFRKHFESCWKPGPSLW